MYRTKIDKIKYFLSLLLITLILLTIGMFYVAIRVKPITITYLGKDYKVKTLANTVRGAVKEKKVFYDDTFNFSPSLDVKIKKGQNIIITKTEKISKLKLDTSDAENIKIIKIEEIKEKLPYETESKENTSLAKGRKKVIQEGKEGEKVAIYKTVYMGDNTVVNQVTMSESVVEPVKEVVEVGTKETQGVTQGSAISVGSSDLEVLARVIYAESRGEPYLGQVAVGAVIVNRVKSSRFPNSIRDVVYAPGQFCTVRDGQINLKPSAQAYNAAQEALNGVDPSNGSLYFFNPRTSSSGWIFTRPVLATIGNHSFSK